MVFLPLPGSLNNMSRVFIVSFFPSQGHQLRRGPQPLVPLRGRDLVHPHASLELLLLPPNEGLHQGQSPLQLAKAGEVEKHFFLLKFQSLNLIDFRNTFTRSA
jgi:hypothetical protein